MQLTPFAALLALLVEGCSLRQGRWVGLEDGAEFRALEVDFIYARKVCLCAILAIIFCLSKPVYIP